MINLADVPAHHKKKILAPEAARCPRCGTWAPRNESRRRHYWEANLQQTTILDVIYGCYICPNCPNDDVRWFTVLPYDLDTLRQYTRRTCRLVVEMVRQFKMSIEGAAEYGRMVLHLEMLNMTTVLDWLRQHADQIDVEARQQELLKAFSGQMDVDEVYDDHYYQLKATDPLNDLELAWEVGEGSPDKDDIRNFFEKLKAAGFYPKLVTTDGSELYPEVITEVWPEAKHQRCVFHFMMQVNKALAPVFWALYHTMPQPPKRKRGRPKKRGRPRKDKEKRENRRKVRKARFLIFKRKAPPGQRGRWTEAELATLDEALSLCPKLGVLRRLIEALHELFGPTTDSHELAEQRRAAIRQDAEIAQLPEITKFLELLGDDDLFARLTRYLDFDCAEKTSNHVERENREYRKRQKGFYRLRSRESICALLGMLTIRKPVPSKPRKLKLRSQDTAAWKEVSTAA